MNIQASNVDRIIFYGSLMSPFDTLEQLGLLEEVSCLGECRIPGRLYDLGEYPALLPAQSDSDRVSAELFRLNGPRALQILDAFEDYLPENEEESLYLRQLVSPEGHDQVAWVYLYNKPVVESKLILCGSWTDYLAQKSKT